jgi:aspartate/methionine/tyrosine aminotransferase
MFEHLFADRTRHVDTSGIRKVFDLAATMTDPINLSIGQPDFDVAEDVKRAAIEAIRTGRNGYGLSQGMPVLREKLQAEVDAAFGHDDREVFVTSGTSGGLMLSLLVLVNPGDEVVMFDPGFGMYATLTSVAGGTPVYVDTYPDFRIDLDRVAEAITPKTKVVVLNSPCNPTGAVADRDAIRGLAELTHQRGVVLLSDEIYHHFCYDTEHVSPAEFNPHTLVVDGFSKSGGMPGWRIGYAHGPKALIHEMVKLQQYSFVCAPHPFQWAAATAMDVDLSPHIEAYRRKRDMIVEGLAGRYELVAPSGAFYAFPKSPQGTASEFVERAIREHDLLVIPGENFSRADTHFRLSYAADDKVIERGIEVLRKMA